MLGRFSCRRLCTGVPAAATAPSTPPPSPRWRAGFVEHLARPLRTTEAPTRQFRAMVWLTGKKLEEDDAAAYTSAARENCSAVSAAFGSRWRWLGGS
ncbi:hypothetical protein HPP92_010648 [Vanilla planifolia]|uniref:Uncharacterized protein n=1 Tax=Vanilla planifolia TaxID=51239 RepID=A0A835R5I8_VANPL|nr:hypothetical protein HPP92_010648 [Vanilla planifolia]